MAKTAPAPTWWSRTSVNDNPGGMSWTSKKLSQPAYCMSDRIRPWCGRWRVGYSRTGAQGRWNAAFSCVWGRILVDGDAPDGSRSSEDPTRKESPSRRRDANGQSGLSRAAASRNSSGSG